jgi:hypothetical protein
MGLLFASLGGVPVIRARLVVPYSGIWHADVTLDRVLPAPLVGPQILSIGGSTWNCSVVRTIDFAGIREARLVGGLGGWRRPIPAAVIPTPLTSPAGVPLSAVLAVAASLAGELPVSTVGFLGSPVLGPAYAFQAGPMSLVLQDVLGDAWWMDPTGKIQTAPRLPTPILSPWTAMAVDGAGGRYEIATESPGDWQPGATFVGPVASGTVSRVAYALTGDSLRVEVMVP